MTVEISLAVLLWGILGWLSAGILCALWAGTGDIFHRSTPSDYWPSIIAAILVWPWFIQWVRMEIQENRDRRFKKKLITYQERFGNVPSTEMLSIISLQIRYSFFRECMNVRADIQE